MVTCPIDLALLQDPRLLPCGHAFCRRCLTDYLNQLPASLDGLQPLADFACPLCRQACPLPSSRQADELPKAFNHRTILDFLADNRAKAKPSPIPGNRSGEASRKQSIQLNTPDQLTSIVQRIAAFSATGFPGCGTFNLAQYQPNYANNTTDIAGQNQLVLLELAEVSRKLERQAVPSAVDRFSGFADRLRSSISRRSSVAGFRKASSSSADSPEYIAYRDGENLRQSMRSNAVYRVLTKGRECSQVMRSGDLKQPVDVQLLRATAQSPQTFRRLTVTTNAERTVVQLWQQLILLDKDNFKPQPHIIPAKSKTNSPLLVHREGRILIDCFDQTLAAKLPVTVTYLRFYQDRLFITGTVKLEQSSNKSSCPELDEYGVIACLRVPNSDAFIPSKQNPAHDDSLFQVECISAPIFRDEIGLQRPDLPLVGGLDIDHRSGDVYAAQPANASIFRLTGNRLEAYDQTWFLNAPQLAPVYLCYASSNNLIWSICPYDDRIVVVDVDRNIYRHFTPSQAFGIQPSHVVYTSDSRVITLDASRSELYWISTVNDTVCAQKLTIDFAASRRGRQKRQFLAIQPVDDAMIGRISEEPASSAAGTADGRVLLIGGVMCAHSFGCSVIYPLKRYKQVVAAHTRARDCFTLCWGPPSTASTDGQHPINEQYQLKGNAETRRQ